MYALETAVNICKSRAYAYTGLHGHPVVSVASKQQQNIGLTVKPTNRKSIQM
jgi:hypothetical protein